MIKKLRKKNKKKLLGFPEILGEKMNRRERRFYNKNEEALDNLLEKGVETFAKIFPIHVSGGLNNLNKVSIDEMIKFAEENKGSE